jgi:hypothetical protein
MAITRWILLRMRNFSSKSCRENQNSHFTFSNFFRKSWHLWDNVEKDDGARGATDDNTARCMLVHYGYTRASTRPRPCIFPPPPSHTHIQKYVILTAFLLQQRFRKRASMLRYTYIVSLVSVIVGGTYSYHGVLKLDTCQIWNFQNSVTEDSSPDRVVTEFSKDILRSAILENEGKMIFESAGKLPANERELYPSRHILGI